MFTAAACLLESDTLQGWRRRSPAAAGPSLTGVISGDGGGGGQGLTWEASRSFVVIP